MSKNLSGYRIYVVCPVCKRALVGYVPKGGDGSQYNARKHKFIARSCPGSFQPAEIAETKTQLRLNGRGRG
jgi:hypothetical protein